MRRVEPRLRYARTSDGMSIAFWAIGEGPALVNLSLPLSHIQREWQIPAFRTIYEWAARVYRFVRFDHRGLGLSERDIGDFSVDALVRDIDAVMDALEVERVKLTAFDIGATGALAYAARHPGRVSHLVVMNGSDRGVDLVANDALTAASQLAARDWEFASEAVTRAFTGWSDDAAREAAALLRDSIDPPQWMALVNQMASWDMSAELTRITAKVLILQNKQVPLRQLPGRRLAARIAQSELILLDGPPAPFLDQAAVANMIRFLGDAAAADPVAEPPREARYRTAAILFADIVDSTGLTERLGDTGFRQRARALDAALRGIVGGRGGEIVEGKLLGDGVLAIFGAATEAISAALECARAGDAAGLLLHLGLHAGDVIRERGNVYGGAVNVAARISAAAAPGEVLVSDVVRVLARTSAGVTFVDRGSHELRGVTEAHRLFRVDRT